MKTRTAGSCLRSRFSPPSSSTGITSTLFDATAQHPDWLGEEPKRLQALAGQRMFGV